MNYLYTFCFLVLSLPLLAQHSHVSIHPSQSGQTLLNSLVNDYKPTINYTYASARDYMFGVVYEENDTVTTIYANFSRYLNPSLDASQTMYDNGNGSTSIDTEHIFPQNKGASGTGKADLHHMAPSRARINSSRGNLAFGNVPDGSVDKWFLGDQELTSAPPVSERYKYSQIDNNSLFEPRDDQKGNVARAMFYFYTMYKADADAADPNFFNSQKATLCQWHIDDPVDSLEWTRTYRIANAQTNMPNPFVLDCTLPQRTYCSSISCTPPNVAVSRIKEAGLTVFDNYPNPIRNKTTISYQLNRTQNVTVYIYDHLGQPVKQLVNEQQTQGFYQVDWEASDMPNGVYFYTIQLADAAYTVTKPMLVAH